MSPRLNNKCKDKGIHKCGEKARGVKSEDDWDRQAIGKNEECYENSKRPTETSQTEKCKGRDLKEGNHK